MNSKVYSGSVLIWFVTLAMLTMAANALAASDDGTANATVITPITITAVNALEFGEVVGTVGGGTVTIGTNSARSGTAALIVSTQGTEQAATFNITGEGTNTYAITLPGNGVVSVDDAGAGVAMPITNFLSNPATTGTLTAGAQTISVGATLNVGASQVPGDYTGSFTVTVEYN